MKKNRKGQVTLYILFIFMAIIIIVVASVVAPMGVLFNTEMVKAGEQILLQANDSMTDIQNTTVRNAIQSSTASALSAGQNNIEVNNAMFQYSWVVVLGIGALVVFLYSRRLVEYGGGGFI